MKGGRGGISGPGPRQKIPPSPPFPKGGFCIIYVLDGFNGGMRKGLLLAAAPFKSSHGQDLGELNDGRDFYVLVDPVDVAHSGTRAG